MYDSFRLLLGKEGRDKIAIPDIPLAEEVTPSLCNRSTCNLFAVVPLQSRVVQGVEIVDHNQIVTGTEKPLAEVRTDKSGAARNKNAHLTPFPCHSGSTIAPLPALADSASAACWVRCLPTLTLYQVPRSLILDSIM